MALARRPVGRDRRLPTAAQVALVAAWLLLVPQPASAQPERPWLEPPVDASVRRGFDLPKGQYGPGNRGLEYAVVEGTSVRAAGDGAIAFAGPVAGVLAITLDHGGGLVSTYTGMRQIFVERGDEVDQGHWLGETTDRFHFGVKLEDVYVDPQDYLGPIDMGDAIHLIPVREKGSWIRTVERLMGREFDGLETIGCTPRALAETSARAPNDNVAVMVGGINTGWARGNSEDIAGVAADLGYESDNSYVFSYSDDPDGYERSDTFGDLRHAARRLDSLLRRIAKETPGASVDILAHSQGGLVARYYLEAIADRGWDPRRPRVDHLVTLSAPHQGAPLAAAAEEVAGEWSGKLAFDGLHRAHRGEDPWPLPDSLRQANPALAVADVAVSWAGSRASDYTPDPYARSIQQMRPESEFIRNLSTDDVVYGTRVLALQDRFDLVVPAGHARWPGEANRSVDGNSESFLGGLNRHRGILDNPEALGMIHGFLRGARLPCLEERDQQAWNTGRRIARGTGLVPFFWRVGEEAVLSIALKGKAPSFKAVVREGSTLWRLLRSRGLRGVSSYGRDKVTYVIRNPREVLEWLVTQRLDAELQRAVDELLEVLVEAEE